MSLSDYSKTEQYKLKKQKQNASEVEASGRLNRLSAAAPALLAAAKDALDCMEESWPQRAATIALRAAISAAERAE